MAVFCLAIVLGFLQVQHGFCAYSSLKEIKWNQLCPPDKCVTKDLTDDKRLFVKSSITDLKGFHDKIYCLKPVDPLSLNGLRVMWFSNHFALSSTSDRAVTLVIGNCTKDVEQGMEQSSTGVWIKSKRVVDNGFGSSPYTVQCAGLKVMSDKPVNINGNQFKFIMERRLNILLFAALFLGLFLFFVSPYLTKNLHFYYSSGILLGVVASLLVLLYIFSKFVPKKNLFGIGVLVGGYTFTGCLLHWIHGQGIVFVEENLFFVACYIIVSGMISFAILYRIGPAHERTMTLVRWFLQLVGLFLIFLSMQFPPFGVAIVTSLLLWNNKPSWIANILSKVFFCVFFCLRPLRRFFRRPIMKKLLTLQEYEEQGVIETERAVNALRSHCRKKGDIWDHLNTFKGENELKDFLVGSDHIPNRQREHHERIYDSEYDSDEYTDSTPHELSYQSSGIPSPNPSTPSSNYSPPSPNPSTPSPPYPRDYISPRSSSRVQMSSSTPNHLSMKYHTTYV